MQIQANLHLCAVGVTKSLGWFAALPLLWGLGTGVLSISMAVPKLSRLKERAMFGGL